MKRVENKIVKVVLTVMGETDVLVFLLLVFLLDENDSEKYVIDLNDSSCQIKIKDVFSKLLEELIEFDINLDLEIQEGYSKGLYKDVCKEYIAELNKELVQVKNSIKKELQ